MIGSLNRMGFEKPTDIQLQAIPLICKGNDVFGQSETGSGKTAAFGIPIVNKVTSDGGLQAMILEPTRELAMQVANEMKKFSLYRKMSITSVYGGTPYNPQIKALKKANIVVGTPGRIIDMMRQGHIDVSRICTFVLDEADKMIDMGFYDDIVTIAKGMPKDRQTLLFSATMPEKLKYIRKKFSRDAKSVVTSQKVDEEMLRQYYCEVSYPKKFSLLAHLLESESPKLSIVFCNARREADDIARNLRENGINTRSIHGGMNQNIREKTMRQFHKGKLDVLVATDVAARGIDVHDVTHIFNYGIPGNAEDYANRIGRTARAGRNGIAISLLSRDDHDAFRRVQNTFSYNIEELRVSNFKLLAFKKHDYHRHSDAGRRTYPKRRPN
ncbi:MAG TPA: DEAD/DEAH box helicase [Candidatus Methanofastidiosa archaeon]|nr:DEAD/DEAH box helicase [Candidatus Methanofastidiosa archaeon]